ncbi:DUF3455 domain-containing protein [Amycolatopsis japonica]|uniref:DUF3455 domain-containing protein n=1 Tax=Amycolatopsis japonica TaxID=208439 RepID=UPI003670446B
MKRIKVFGSMILIMASVAGPAGVAGATPANAPGAAEYSQAVPAAIRVPAGNKQVAAFSAVGVQIYGCTGGAWSLIQPAATLSRRGVPAAIHGKGPIWTSTIDGTSVTAAAVGSSPQPGAIPQLLLKATANYGDGIFGSVSYIQRLNTRGGVAPTGYCAEGAQTAVHYTADYTFWNPA